MLTIWHQEELRLPCSRWLRKYQKCGRRNRLAPRVAIFCHEGSAVTAPAYTDRLGQSLLASGSPGQIRTSCQTYYISAAVVPAGERQIRC